MQFIKNISILFLFLFGFSAFSQVESDDEVIQEEIDFRDKKTNNIENQIVQHASLVEKEEKLVEIRKTNTRNTYTGNLCADEIARKYHFKYVFDHDGGNGIRYFVANQLKFMRLTFKNGLFWKARYRHELRDCVSRSGDFVG